MQRPPPDPRFRSRPKTPTWRSVIAAYAVVAALPVLFWAVSNPLAGGVGLAAALALRATARRGAKLRRCLRDCEGFAVDLGESVRVTVTRPPADECC